MNDAELSRVKAWHAIYLDSRRFPTVVAYAKQAEIDAKKAGKDTWSKASIEQQVSTIKWAEEHIIGGAKACASMAHIKATKKKPVVKVKDTTEYKVRTISGSDFVKEMVAEGIERKTAIKIAKNMRFA